MSTEYPNPTRPPTRRSTCQCEAQVGSCHQLDALHLERDGVFADASGTVHLAAITSGGAIVSAVAYVVQHGDAGPEALSVVQLVAQGPQGASQVQRFPVLTVRLVLAARNRGKHHWWFRCPGWQEGAPCRRHVRTLHLPFGATRFACFHCQHRDAASFFRNLISLDGRLE